MRYVDDSNKKHGKFVQYVLGTEIWLLMMACFFQDFPFFITRLTILIKYKLSKNFMLYFLISKNFMLSCLELYRIYIIVKEEKKRQEEAEIERIRKEEEEKLREENKEREEELERERKRKEEEEERARIEEENRKKKNATPFDNPKFKKSSYMKKFVTVKLMTEQLNSWNSLLNQQLQEFNPKQNNLSRVSD